MTLPDLPPGDGDVEFIELTIRMDATLSINGVDNGPQEWIKPGVEGRIRFRGPTGPNEDQLRAGSQYIQQDIIAPALEDVIILISDRMVNHRRGKN